MPVIIRNTGIFSRMEGLLHRNLFLLKSYSTIKDAGARGRAFLPQKNSLFRKVCIETVSYCDNDCAFCPASAAAGEKKPDHLMEEGLFEKIVRELAGLSFKGTIAFHGNNEPLLDPFLPARAAYARSRLPDAFMYLYTNGRHARVSVINGLFDAGIDRIVVNNYHDTRTLIPSVRELVRARETLRGEVVVRYRSKNEYKGNRAGQSPNAHGILKEPLRSRCLRPSVEMLIGYDGTVPLCCADGLWRTAMGNVQQATLAEVWFSRGFTALRGSLARGERGCADICRVCDSVSFPALKGLRE